MRFIGKFVNLQNPFNISSIRRKQHIVVVVRELVLLRPPKLSLLYSTPIELRGDAPRHTNTKTDKTLTGDVFELKIHWEEGGEYELRIRTHKFFI